MRLFVLIIALFITGFKLIAQNTGQFIIVTIEKATNGNLHKNETDYWIVLKDSIDKSLTKSVIPLYLTGFSATDYHECCSEKAMILFNVTTKESFNYEKGIEEAQDKLIKLVLEKREKIQIIKKRYPTGYKEKIKVYLTPIKGSFCLCSIIHKDDNYKLGYEGLIAVPVSDFVYDANFWKLQEFIEVAQFDYDKLPFLSLQTIQ